MEKSKQGAMQDKSGHWSQGHPVLIPFHRLLDRLDDYCLRSSLNRPINYSIGGSRQESGYDESAIKQAAETVRKAG